MKKYASNINRIKTELLCDNVLRTYPLWIKTQEKRDDGDNYKLKYQREHLSIHPETSDHEIIRLFFEAVWDDIEHDHKPWPELKECFAHKNKLIELVKLGQKASLKKIIDVDPQKQSEELTKLLKNLNEVNNHFETVLECFTRHEYMGYDDVKLDEQIVHYMNSHKFIYTRKPIKRDAKEVKVSKDVYNKYFRKFRQSKNVTGEFLEVNQDVSLWVLGKDIDDTWSRTFSKYGANLAFIAASLAVLYTVQNHDQVYDYVSSQNYTNMTDWLPNNSTKMGDWLPDVSKYVPSDYLPGFNFTRNMATVGSGIYTQGSKAWNFVNDKGADLMDYLRGTGTDTCKVKDYLNKVDNTEGTAGHYTQCWELLRDIPWPNLTEDKQNPECANLAKDLIGKGFTREQYTDPTCS